MSTKKKVGRPRKYSSDAERKKAYRKRQKEKIKKLEERIDVLEKKLIKSDNVEK